MDRTRSISAVVIATALGLAACTTPPYSQSQSNYPSGSYPSSQYPSNYSRYGYVESIETIADERRSGIGGTGVGIGAIGGAIAGGVLGNQVGSGSGRAAATVGGAIAGGVIGDQVEKRVNNNRADGVGSYRLRVRMDDGSYQTFTQDRVDNIRVGDRVRIDNGQVWPS
jgi:outer membrane lipoprotein SlyB